MRTSHLLLLISAVAGCATGPAVVPSGGRPEGSAEAAGAVLTVFAAPWSGAPYDLGDYVTPVALALENRGANPVRLTYVDLVLTDAQGHRYAAIDPFVEPHASLDFRHDATLLAARGMGGRGAPPRAAPPLRHGAGIPVVVPPVARAQSFAVGRYRPYLHYRPYYGGAVSYFGVPFIVPYGYATWVWDWSPVYYPSPRVPGDVIALAVPQGVLDPGGHISGYVYFERVPPSLRALQLTWEVHDAQSGAVLSQATVPLEVNP